MSGGSNGKNKKKDTAAAECKDEQVDELLRAAQDDMLLKLSINSHMARGFGSSSQFSGINSDLDSRFQALKKPHQAKSKLKCDLDAATTTIGSEKKNPGQSDDLFARFAALKGSLPSYSTSSSAASSVVGIGNTSDQVQQQQQQQEEVLMDDDNEEHEVEKVIKWAIDAARLDPSPPSDSDSDDDHSDDTDDDHGVDAGKKSKRK